MRKEPKEIGELSDAAREKGRNKRELWKNIVMKIKQVPCAKSGGRGKTTSAISTLKHAQDRKNLDT